MFSIFGKVLHCARGIVNIMEDVWVIIGYSFISFSLFNILMIVVGSLALENLRLDLQYYLQSCLHIIIYN